MVSPRAIRFGKWLVATIVAAIAIVIVAVEVFHVGSVALPEYQPISADSLPQNWEPGWNVGQSQWFHHASQGTRILRADWFMALEQPELSIFSTPDLLHLSSYLERFGFLPSTVDAKDNPHGLPIGFATDPAFQEPFLKDPLRDDEQSAPQYADPPYAVIGLTCAACHTGQINFHGRGVRVEGGPAMIDLGLFQEAIGTALFYTRKLPFRFERFARRVLGNDYNNASRQKLKDDLDKFLGARIKEREYSEKKHLYDLRAGFGRTDAIGLIGNRAFKDLNVENLSITDAPVNFPPLWDTSWFYWVQYNGSIRLPMVRNIGEAAGVGAVVNTDLSRGRMFDSTVNVKNLHLMEHQLAGDAPFQGLSSPKWPETVAGKPFLPAIDQKLAEEGRLLFEGERFRCLGCHSTIAKLRAEMQPVVALESAAPTFSPDREPSPRWVKDNFQKRPVIALPTLDLERVGTDPAQAVNFQRRIVSTGVSRLTLGEALDKLTGEIRELKYKELGLSPEEMLEFDGYRIRLDSNELTKVQLRYDGNDISPRRKGELQLTPNSAVRARLGYKARPLNGIWATAPYLHNGSVPNLYELLGPAHERSKKFYVGSKEFDSKKVGFQTTRFAAGFEFDTQKPGNLNCGHEFRDTATDEGVLDYEYPDDPQSKKIRRVSGVIGPSLAPREREALVEYLKTL